MTLIASFFSPTTSPIVISDSLVTMNEAGQNPPLEFSYFGKNHYFTSGYREVQHRQKTQILSPEFAVAWAGDVDEARDAIANISLIVSTTTPNIALPQIESFLESLKGYSRLSLMVLFGIPQERGSTGGIRHINCNHGFNNGVSCIAGGSASELVFQPSKFLGQPGKNRRILGWSTGDCRAAALNTIANCFISLAMSEQAQSLRFGGFFELMTYQSGWKKQDVAINTILKTRDSLEIVFHSRTLSINAYSICVGFNPGEYFALGKESIKYAILMPFMISTENDFLFEWNMPEALGKTDVPEIQFVFEEGKLLTHFSVHFTNDPLVEYSRIAGARDISESIDKEVLEEILRAQH